jgi:hypothetical protein
MATVAAPVTTLLLQAPLPDLVQSCVIAPPLEPSPVDDPDAPFAPLPPGVSLDDVAVIGEEQLIDTSPDQLIGCIIDTEDNPQGRLNALFPDAEAGDGVIERSTSHFWVYDGSEWNDVGPNPGPRLIITSILSPINEIFVVSAPTRTKIRVTALAYALQLLTEPDPFVVRTTLEAEAVTAVKVPSTALTLQSATPQVSISARVDIPASSTQVAAIPPAAASGAAVITPAISTSVTGVTPDLIGRLRISINVPASDTELTTTAPSVATGAVVSLPARDIGLSAVPPAILDSDAAAYIIAVEAADTQSLETGVKSAINDFVVGCKDDGIWNAIKASCILAGARTLTGALVPLVGTTPTNNNFASGDYNRKTGLVGNESTKYLNSNRAGNADPQNSKHVSVYATSLPTTTSKPLLGQHRLNTEATGATLIYNTLTRLHDGASSTYVASAGFIGASRSESANYVRRNDSANTTLTQASSTPVSRNIVLFADNLENAPTYSNARFAFYSIGESLDLALLDARVTTLIDDIDAAIT